MAMLNTLSATSHGLRILASEANADAQPAQVVAQIGENPLGTPWPPRPATLLRRSVTLTKTVRRARLYVTALGAYQFSYQRQCSWP